jgi:hypothetical protein
VQCIYSERNSGNLWRRDIRYDKHSFELSINTCLFEYNPHWRHMHKVRDLDTSIRIVGEGKNPT